jgi:hypothetical protein
MVAPPARPTGLIRGAGVGTRPGRLQLLLLLLALSAVSGPAPGQATSLEAQLIAPSDGLTFDSFGRSVSISGSRALVTAFADDDHGSAYTLSWNGSAWVFDQKLVPAGAAIQDLTGLSATLDGDLAALGVSGDDDLGSGSGSVAVFRHDGSGWVRAPKVLASDGQANDQFGFSVSLAGDLLVVGAPDEDAVGADGGAVYVFRWNGTAFVEEQKLGAGQAAAGSLLGWNVATDGALIAATALGDAQGGGAEAGAVHVWRHDGATWIHEQKLVASDAAAGAWFGWGLDVQGDVLVAGATHAAAVAGDSGAAYVFRRSGTSWTEEQQLLPDSLGTYHLLGWSVAIDGDRVLVGCPGAPVVNGAGGAYVFQDSGPQWVESHRWLTSNPNAGGLFFDSAGMSVALQGKRALVGAPFATNPVTGQVDAGAAYAYAVTPLALDALPDAVSAGQGLEFRTYGGLPGGPIGLFLTAVNGSPFNLLFFVGAFDAEGRSSLPLVVPAGLTGIQITVQALGHWQTGSYAGSSNPVVVSFT